MQGKPRAKGSPRQLERGLARKLPGSWAANCGGCSQCKLERRLGERGGSVWAGYPGLSSWRAGVGEGAQECGAGGKGLCAQAEVQAKAGAWQAKGLMWRRCGGSLVRADGTQGPRGWLRDSPGDACIQGMQLRAWGMEAGW